MTFASWFVKLWQNKYFDSLVIAKNIFANDYNFVALVT